MATIAIPDKITVDVQGSAIAIKGPLGELKRGFPSTLTISKNGNDVEVNSKEKAMTNTVIAHIRNMFKGVKDGYKVKMKIIHAHFPISIEIKGKEIMIKNFLGEKVPRKAKIIGNTKVEAKGQEVFISCIDKEALGATVSNIKMATKIKNRDSRVFQDGLYIIE